MSYANKSELKTAITSALKRSDLSTKYDEYIDLAQADANAAMGADFALPGDSSTNWLLENAPGVYLHGSVYYAALLGTRDADMQSTHSTLYLRAVDLAHLKKRKDEGFADATLRSDDIVDLVGRSTFDITRG